MTLSEIITHIKQVENDNSVDTNFLKTLLWRFARQFAREISHTSLLTSGTLTISNIGKQNITLASDFIKPLQHDMFWLNDATSTRYTMMKLAMALPEGYYGATGYIVLLDDINCYANFTDTGTLNYYYFKYQDETIGDADTPDIPANYLIEGTRVLYQNSMGYISKADMDAMLYHILLQAETEDSKIDSRVNAFMMNDHKLTNNFRR